MSLHVLATQILGLLIFFWATALAFFDITHGQRIFLFRIGFLVALLAVGASVLLAKMKPR